MAGRFKLTTGRAWALYLALALALLLTGPGGSLPAGCGAAAATNPHAPASYCWYFDTEITNGTGSDLTDAMTRVELNSANLIAAQQLDPEAWSVYSQTGSYSNWVQTMAQDLDQIDSGWWLQVPDLPNGETRTVRTYFKNSEQQRNQGVYFTGGETVTAPDDSTLDLALSTEVNIVFEILNTDETARDELIIDKHNGTFNGYRIGFRDTAGTLELYSQVDSDSVCAIAWNSSWTDEITEFNWNYDAASGVDTEWYVNGVLTNLCNAGSNNPPNATTELFAVGESELTGALVTDVKVFNSQIAGNEPDLHWQFNPHNMAETSAFDPTYIGTVTDTSPGGRDGTYTFTRSQSGLTVNNGVPQRTSGGTSASVPSSIVAVSGDPLSGDIYGTDENTRSPFYGWFDSVIDIMPWGRQASWLTIGFLPAMLAGAMFTALWRKWLSFVIGAGLVYALLNANGVISDWWLLVWALAIAGSMGLDKWDRQS